MVERELLFQLLKALWQLGRSQSVRLLLLLLLPLAQDRRLVVVVFEFSTRRLIVYIIKSQFLLDPKDQLLERFKLETLQFLYNLFGRLSLDVVHIAISAENHENAIDVDILDDVLVNKVPDFRMEGPESYELVRVILEGL